MAQCTAAVGHVACHVTQQEVAKPRFDSSTMCYSLHHEDMISENRNKRHLQFIRTRGKTLFYQKGQAQNTMI